ncbi:MAG: efflux RND transporter periplasmic adaptor subunit [Desulfobacterales bacterium]|nr:efflux RND transporter periplasmic adaptor subunit [Desulfobacterales bacterium]
MKRAKWWVATGALLLLAIAALTLQKGGRTEQVAYRTAPVRKGSIRAVVASTGRLAPLNIVEVGSQISGYIREVFANDNDRVKKDQILARIDPVLYAGQVAEARARLAKAKMEHLEIDDAIHVARASLKSAEAQQFVARATLADAQRTYTRLDTLAGRRAMAGAERDTALTRRDQAIGRLQMAEAQVETAGAQLARALGKRKTAAASVDERRAGLDLAGIKLDYCTIRSPIDGVVIRRDVDPGQSIAATLQSPVFFEIAEDLTRMQVEVDVSEADVGRIEAGQTVEFTVDAFADRTFTAVVRQVRNAATSIQNVVTYKVVADVDNDQRLLRPGMTANVAILVSAVKKALLLPNAALRYRPGVAAKVRSGAPEKRPVPETLHRRSSGIQRRARVYVPGENGPEAIEVILGITDETETEVIGDDLAEGNRVIIGKAVSKPDRMKTAGSLLSRLRPKG